MYLVAGPDWAGRDIPAKNQRWIEPEPDVDPEALYNHFMQTHYHGATDDQELRFDRESAAKVATANFMITLEIANAKTRPKWRKGDFFGDLYGTELTRTP